MPFTKFPRILIPLSISCGFLIILYLYSPAFQPVVYSSHGNPPEVILETDFDIPSLPAQNGEYFWAKLPQRYPVQSTTPVPPPIPHSIPVIQHRFPPEEPTARTIRLARLNAVKGNFTHAWEGYKKYAWMSDEVAPLSGRAHNPFGGWAATLVDTLGPLVNPHLSIFIDFLFPVYLLYKT